MPFFPSVRGQWGWRTIADPRRKEGTSRKEIQHDLFFFRTTPWTRNGEDSKLTASESVHKYGVWLNCNSLVARIVQANSGRSWKQQQDQNVQRFRVRHGLSCVIGPVWPVGAGCYSQAALPMPLSKPLYYLVSDATMPTTASPIAGVLPKTSATAPPQ